jgi:hypothetical protein
VDQINKQSNIQVSINSATDIGAGYFIFNYSDLEIGEPELSSRAAGMSIKYANDGSQLKVLVYSLEKGIKIPAGTESIFTVPISGRGNIELDDVQLSDYQGNLLEANFDKPEALPENYALRQNFPNPFNAATTIMYALPVDAPVKIEVFNILGQKVAILVDGPQPAGVHSIIWNSDDDSGRSLASGVYFYRITTPEFTAEKKMVLMK